MPTTRIRAQRSQAARPQLVAVCPETALLYAVLEDAFLCFNKESETVPRLIDRAREAEAWFFSDDSRWLFSFVPVCVALGLEPGYVRKKLRHWTASTPCLDTAPPTR